MFPGKINPRQMQAVMRQMGIKTEELQAKKVIFELEGKKLVIEEPQVSVMTVQGQKNYTVMGGIEKEETAIPQEDIEMVMEQEAGVNEKQAKKALEETNGDIAQAISKLKKK